MDGDITSLHTNNLLVWQPAHQSVLSIGQRKGSDGHKVSTKDWRANRLVDAIAKQGAEMFRASIATRALVASARMANIHAACNLGRITFAANNHRVDSMDEFGNTVTTICRDSRACSKKKRARRE